MDGRFCLEWWLKPHFIGFLPRYKMPNQNFERVHRADDCRRFSTLIIDTCAFWYSLILARSLTLFLPIAVIWSQCEQYYIDT